SADEPATNRDSIRCFQSQKNGISGCQETHENIPRRKKLVPKDLFHDNLSPRLSDVSKEICSSKAACHKSSTSISSATVLYRVSQGLRVESLASFGREQR